MSLYNPRAAKRPVNLSLNADLVLQVRGLTGNLSERVEALLGEYLEAEHAKRAEADGALCKAVAAWNGFGDRVGTFADDHSTL